MYRKYKSLAEFYKIFGNPIRLAIIELAKNKAVSINEIRENLKVSDKVVAQHVARMRRLHFLEAERKGRNTYYSISDQEILKINEMARSTFKKLVKEISRDFQ